MSATGRNKPGRERRDADFYPTPAWCTRAIMPHVGFYPRHTNRLLAVLDPCCGDGAILDVLKDEFGASTWGVELDYERACAAGKKHDHQDFRKVSHGDALSESWPEHVDLVITNPPFALASEFVSRFISLFTAKETGELRIDGAFLLGLNFATSAARASFHRGFPSDLYILPKRPSFTGDGKSDMSDYAWFVFGPNRGGRWKVLEVDP
jgi:hypothetical protein